MHFIRARLPTFLYSLLPEHVLASAQKWLRSIQWCCYLGLPCCEGLGDGLIGVQSGQNSPNKAPTTLYFFPAIGNHAAHFGVPNSHPSIKPQHHLASVLSCRAFSSIYMLVTTCLTSTACKAASSLASPPYCPAALQTCLIAKATSVAWKVKWVTCVCAVCLCSCLFCCHEAS